MILLTKSGQKVKALKAKKPNFQKGFWDSVEKQIDGKNQLFNYSLKSNATHFYFMVGREWYKVDMVQEGIDNFFDYDGGLTVD